MIESNKLPLYYGNKTLADMEAALRGDYLHKSGWLESADRKLALRAGNPIPWFTYPAIDFLERELTQHQAMFEFGCGQSTVYWAQRLKRVVGIDHDPAFVAHVSENLPANAKLQLIEEGAPLSDEMAKWSLHLPRLIDPERSQATLRSGRLNGAFQKYALSLLEYLPGEFDVIVVDGMARILCSWSAVNYLQSKGFVIFDNSDREIYQQGYDILADAGYRRLDFWGLGPVNPYQWCTSVFYRPERFLGTRWFAEPRAGPGADAPAKGLGILVLGFNRAFHLQSVLESLRLQGHIEKVHAWIDGTHGRGEYLQANNHTVEIAKRYALKELRVRHGHAGIEKVMLEALEDMSARYDRVLVLEDDCFPLEGAVDAFEAELAAVADDPTVYSVYGHHFGLEPPESQDFTRFQGWGWAAHSHQIRKLLPRLKELFLLDEEAYVREVGAQLTADVRDRLDRTPPRNVLNALKRCFSWDSATAFLTAGQALKHRRTRAPSVVNTGIVAGIGHFQEDLPWLRTPPFNMITLEEAWSRYDRTTAPCDYSKASYGLEQLDLLIRAAIPLETGFFIEIGAHDGITQSNSAILEAAGWRGMLIEANPGSFAKAVKARPKALVEHAACVGTRHAGTTTTITDVGLMSMTAESSMDEATRSDWLSRGEGFTKRPRQEIEVPTATISSLLDKHGIARVDLLILDVEGAEIEVLKGVDFDRHAPAYIVAEDAYDHGPGVFLAEKNYSRTVVLLQRKYTRDCLYVRAS